jgi:hypothetical protein
VGGGIKLWPTHTYTTCVEKEKHLTLKLLYSSMSLQFRLTDEITVHELFDTANLYDVTIIYDKDLPDYYRTMFMELWTNNVWSGRGSIEFFRNSITFRSREKDFKTHIDKIKEINIIVNERYEKYLEEKRIEGIEIGKRDKEKEKHIKKLKKDIKDMIKNESYIR